MKKIAKGLVVMGAMMAAGGATAGVDELGWDTFNPYIGADYYQAWMGGKNGYQQLFKKTYPGYSIYIGSKFHEFVGLELGFDNSVRKNKTATSVEDGVTANTTASVRRIGGHVDLVGFLPIMDNCFELFGAVGWGWIKPKVSVTANSVTGGTAAANASVASALNSISGKGKSVFRIGVGASYMITDCIGLRAKVGWETTSALRVQGNSAFTANGFSTKAFKTSTTMNLGAFVRF